MTDHNLAITHLPIEELAHLKGNPRKGDVICRRYQELTGELPIRRGETVDFTGQEEE